MTRPRHGLARVLSKRGLCSRSEAERLVREGRVQLDGRIVRDPEHPADLERAQVAIDGVDSVAVAPRFLMLNKPRGLVTTLRDERGRDTVYRCFEGMALGHIAPVGRLDKASEGLLLFTSSGELANKLMHPRFGLEREYAVRVLGALSNEEKQRLLEGVRLDDGMAAFGSIEDGGGEGSNCWYRVTISEGRNREVRRMMEAVGHAVSRLIRIRYGAMMLPRGLKRGAWLELDDADIRSLLKAAGGSQHADGADHQGGSAAARRSGPPPLGRSGGVAAGRGRRAPGGPAGSQGAARGRRGESAGSAGDRSRAGAQPDPMKTSVGYIGSDSLSRYRQAQKLTGGGRRGRSR